MSDIVERLRALVIIDEVMSDNSLGRDAADEIERLRAALRIMRAKLYRAARATGNDDETATAACSVADAALAGKGE